MNEITGTKVKQNERLSADRIRETLDQHIGSATRYKHWARQFIYTPGVRDMARLCEAYWLIDLIAGLCFHPKVAGEEFVVWKLVHPDRGATLTADDGNERILYTRRIPLTDFPLPEISLYLTDGVLLLPNEY